MMPMDVYEDDGVLHYRCYQCNARGDAKCTRSIEKVDDVIEMLPEGWEYKRIHGTRRLGFVDGSLDRTVFICDSCAKSMKGDKRKDRTALTDVMMNVHCNPSMYDDLDICELASRADSLCKYLREEAERRGILEQI